MVGTWWAHGGLMVGTWWAHGGLMVGSWWAHGAVLLEKTGIYIPTPRQGGGQSGSQPH